MRKSVLEKALKKMTTDEKDAFDWFCERFRKGQTYKSHHKNLRKALMNDYGLINLDRYRRLRNGEKEEYKIILG